MEDHRSTTRVLDILETVSEKKDLKLTLTNIARELHAPKSSIFPMLQTLVDRAYLNYDSQTLTYSIGPRAYAVGMKYTEDGGFYQDIDKILSNITEKCQETSHFAELLGNEVFYLNKKDSPQSIRMYSFPGRTLPAYATGLGKALLSGKSEEEIREMYPDGLKVITENTVTSFDLLFKQLEEVRKSSFAFEIEESNESIRCIAVPIEFNGAVRYAISVAVPVYRYTKEKEKQIEELLLEAKHQIEIEMFSTKKHR